PAALSPPKRGRPQDTGIRNQHVKSPDGTELELITAPEARDALTTTYRRHLEQGDGPAFLALYAPRIAYAGEQLTAAKAPHTVSGGSIDFPGDGGLAYLFLAGRNTSPTDRPEHFAHANTAQSLVRVWLAAGDLSRERRLLEALGATFIDADVRVPDAVRTTVARFAEGDVVLVPAPRPPGPGPPQRRRNAACGQPRDRPQHPGTRPAVAARDRRLLRRTERVPS